MKKEYSDKEIVKICKTSDCCQCPFRIEPDDDHQYYRCNQTRISETDFPFTWE